MTALDVLVIGGGPSGLAAAAAAGREGASVLLVDEWPVIGGRLRYRAADATIGDATFAAAALRTSLVERAIAAGVEIRTGTVAWAAFAGSAGMEIGLRGDGRGSEVVMPGRVILATGTTDRTTTVRGGTCPGVMTARALQILLHIHQVRPGRRFGILGDDRLDELGRDIEAADGVVVTAVAASELATAAIQGVDGVQGLSVGGETVEVDVVVTALGTLPDTQLAGMLGCDFTSDGTWPPSPRRGADGSLSVPGVVLCGTAAGAVSIEESILDGARVGGGGYDDGDGKRLLAALTSSGVARG